MLVHTSFLRFLSRATICLLLWQLLTVTAFAQREISPCPIESPVGVRLQTEATVLDGDAAAVEIPIAITNDSSYLMGGVKVGVAAFRAGETIPAYLMVLPEEYLVPAGGVVTESVAMTAAAVAPGMYTVQVFAMQGDEAALLGAMIEQGSQGSSLQLSKKSPATQTLSVAVAAANTQKSEVSLEPFGVFPFAYTVGNKGSDVVVGKVLSVFTYGTVPLGAAVQHHEIKSIGLIPEASVTGTFEERQVPEGVHSAYFTALIADSLQPLTRIAVLVGQERPEISSLYLAQVGVTEYPLSQKGEIVACVEYTGSKSKNRGLFGEVAFDFSINVGEKTLRSARLESAGAPDPYVSFTPGEVPAEVQVVTELSLLEKNPYAEASGETSRLLPAGIVAQTLSCPPETECGTSGESSEGDGDTEEESAVHNSLVWWQYVGIGVALGLVLYLVWLRIARKEEGEAEELVDIDQQI